MFTKRQLVKLDKSLGAKLERMQYSNRVKIRPYEEKLGRFAGLVMVIVVTVLIFIGNFTKPVMAEPDIEKEVVIQSVNPVVVPVKIGASDFQNEMISYAWDISGNDFDFIKLIEAESGWIVDRVSPPNSNGSVDYGLCQINGGYHRQIVTDPKFNDWRWELDTCYQMYAGNVTFYGINNINKDSIINNFEWRGR